MDNKHCALVIEDDRVVRLMLSEQIRARGYQVDSCGDGDQAVALIDSHEYALILLDWLLPGVSGQSICQYVRSLCQYDTCVIVVVTGHDQPQTLDQVLDAGADDYMIKPISSHQLHIRLNVALNRVDKEQRRKHVQQQVAASESIQIQSRLAERLTGAENVEQVVDRLLDAVVQFDSVDAAGLYLYDPARTGLQLVGTRNLPQWFVEQVGWYGPQSSQFQQVMAGEPFTYQLQQARPAVARALAQLELMGVEYIPMKLNSKVIGVLSLGSRDCRSIPAKVLAGVNAAANQAGWLLSVFMAREVLDRELLFTQTLLSALPVAVAAKNTAGQFISCNAAFEQLTGLRSSDLLGRTEMEIRTPISGLRPWHQRDIAAIQEGQGYQIELSLEDGDSGHRYYQRQCVLFEDHRRQVAGLIILLFDETDKRHAEQQLRQSHDALEQQVDQRTAALRQSNERLERVVGEVAAKNAELEKFTYTVSHDLRSPLTTVRGFLSYIRRSAEQGDIEQLKADLARIEDATVRMNDLLTGLLELSRVGRVVNDPTNVSMQTLVDDALSLLNALISSRHVKVTVDPALPVVFGDAARLRQALQNILENAVKFMGDQKDPQIHIGMRPGSDGDVVFYVQDNGIGIDPLHHQKVFGLFDKLDRQSSGTGLGLSLVQRIIQHHGGQIWVESDGAGRGARFCFTLAGPELTDAEGHDAG